MSGGSAAVVVGIDVGGARKGFHAVALGAGAVIDRCRTADPQGLARWCAGLGAALVAVDAPGSWGDGGGARPAELALMQVGIPCFASPSRDQALGHPTNYYGWMLCGEALYGALEACGYPLADGPPQPDERRCFETFPHAITALAHRALGLGPAQARHKRQQRRQLLERCGVNTAELRGIDWIDAALCALAAQRLAAGAPCSVYGAVDSGVLLLPSAAAW